MTRVTLEKGSEPALVGTARTSSKRLHAIFLATLVLGASLCGAVIAMQTAHGLSFGLQAARDAGENPTVEQSRRVERFVAQQAYLNAILTGCALASILVLASELLGWMTRAGYTFDFWRSFRAFLLANVVGGTGLFFACFAFRLQSVGTQNLVTATIIHSATWMVLGVVVSRFALMPNGSKGGLSTPILAGLIWGVCFPTLATIIWPDAYVEQLFSTHRIVLFWAAGGCVALLTGSIIGDFRSKAESGTEGEHCKVE